MKTKNLGFIGGGRITRIFLQAFANKDVRFKSITVHDHNPETAAFLKKQFPDIILSELEEAASRDVVMIALHPPVIMETLEKIKSIVSDKSTLISLAPKITIGKISGKLGKVNHIVRLIPNATSIINQGYNPVCFAPAMQEEDKIALVQMLGVLGDTFEVDESKLEAYAIVSAMAPTYFWFQWKKLCDIGEKIGLDKEDAELAVEQSLGAALNTLFSSGLSWSEVNDLIPVKPIGEYEEEISTMLEQKLVGLHQKISP
jgi:pyrroline-5-carboxylate reductase